MRKHLISSAGAAAIALIAATPAWAEPPPAQEPDLNIQAEPIGQWTGLWTRSNLFGDMGGLRTWMGNYGLSLNLTETSEYLSNTSGGLKTGGAYDGLTTATLQLDTQKAFGWQGGQFNVSFMNLHGSDLSQTNLGTLNTASGIEQPQNWTRLWEAWYDQKFMGNSFDVKIGQQSLDQEFMVSQNAGVFVNTMLGWPGLPSYDMPFGGPAYPLSALGVRLRTKITPSLTALVGVFDGSPQGNDPTNLHGTNFNVQNSALFIGELQYSINGAAANEGDMVSPDRQGLPGLYKIGVWYNTGPFYDPRYDNTGLSLTNPNSTGIPRQYRGDYSIYAVADQTIWQPNPDEPRALNAFARVMAAPGNRVAPGASFGVSLSANAGLVLKEPFDGRDNDSLGIGLSYIRIGSHSVGADQDNGYAVRSSETALELTYQYQAAPWLVIQPDIQYTIHPGAGQNPNNQLQSLSNTFVVGVRTTITF